MAKPIYKTANQTATIITNDVTKQFYITFNNMDATKKGIKRIVGNFKWIEKRTKEIENGTKPLSRTPSILHLFEDGAMWMLKNSNVEDWKEWRTDTCSLEKTTDYLEKWTTKLEQSGYATARSTIAKGPEARFYGEYAWGTWNPNKTLKQWQRMFDKIMIAINTQIDPKIISDAWFEANKGRPTINNKYDLWKFLDSKDVFKNKEE